MQKVKRVEIIIDTPDVPRIVEIVRATGISGYTLIDNVKGSGDRGERRGDDLTLVEKNSYLLIACEEQQAETLVASLREILTAVGGVVLVSDAQWVKH